MAEYIDKIVIDGVEHDLKDSRLTQEVSQLAQVVSQLIGGGDIFPKHRFMTFGFSDSNHKSVKIAAGTTLELPITEDGNTVREFLRITEDTEFDLSSDMTTAANAASTRTGEENGRDYYVYLAPDTEGVKLVASLNDTAPSDIDESYTTSNTRKIGQFHTLCVDAGATLTGLIPADLGSLAVNDYTLVKNVSEDSDFYDFYNRKVTAVSSNAIYDTVTVEHVLKGFTAGQILPESVWCLSFRPNSKADGMVYDPETDTAVDIYLQSGKGRNTKSVYGGTTIRTRQQENHQADMRAVGKLLISDSEFTSAALGSNEKTAIYGAAESSIISTGGHVDTTSRRMVSFIGAEDMCGGVWQWLRDVCANGGTNFTTYDGVGNFGQTFGTSNALLAGGPWLSGASCGSRCRAASYARSVVTAGLGGRGVSRVVRGV